MNFTFVCIDTAGSDPAMHGIIEVAAVRGFITADSFEIDEEKFHTYVEPHDSTSVNMKSIRKIKHWDGMRWNPSGDDKWPMREAEAYTSLSAFDSYDYKLSTAGWWSHNAAWDGAFWSALESRIGGYHLARPPYNEGMLCTRQLSTMLVGTGKLPTKAANTILTYQADALGVDWKHEHGNLLDSAVVGAKVLNALLKMGGMV